MGNIYPALGALIGGGTGALDKIDGAGLANGDAATVVLDSGVYHYHLDATSGAAENSPYVIAPDTNPGTKRWLLITPAGAFSHVRASQNTGQTMVNNTVTTVIFNIEEYDKLAEYNNTTGVFTAIYTGLYTVSARTFYDLATWADNFSVIISTQINSVLDKEITRVYGNPHSQTYLSAQGAITVELTAGQTLEIVAEQRSNGNRTLYTDSFYTWLTIDRIA